MTAIVLDGAIAPPCLGGVSLRVMPGERVALVGPNGAGKTSLLRVVAGLLPITGGEARCPSPVGLVPQGYARSLLPWWSAGENVALPLVAEGLSARERGERVLEALSFVPLDPALLTRRVGDLSGGQQQLVALARAVAARPRALLLDEPFSALDPAARRGVRAGLLRLFASRPSALLLVSHDEADVAALAHRVIEVEGPPLRLRDQGTLERPGAARPS